MLHLFGDVRRHVGGRRACRSSFLRRVGVAAFIAAGLFAASPASAFDDATPAEQSALNVRTLQSDMMVAALSCQLRNDYNVMVKRFGPELARHGSALRSLFARTYGRSSEAELNKYVTRLANESSARRLHAGADYCSNAAASFAQLRTLAPRQLAAFSDTQSLLAAVPAPSSRPRPRPSVEVRQATAGQ